MKWLWTAMISAAVLSPAWSLQQAPAQPSMSEKSAAEPEPQLGDTDLVAELSHSLAAKKAKVGDLVKANLAQDVIVHGKIAVPRGSKLVGRVTEAKALTKIDQESRLGLIFDKVVFKNGQEISVQAVIRALAAPVHLTVLDQQDQTYSGTGTMIRGTRDRSPFPGATGLARHANNTAFGMGLANGSRVNPSAPSGPTSPGGHPEAQGGLLSGGSRGIFGLPGLRLGPESGSEPMTVISSASHNVKLDDRTQMVIQIQAVAR